MNIGVNIQKARNAAGLTQDEVAKYLGVHHNTIQQYEVGVREPSVTTLIRLADMFGCTVNDFVYEDPILKIVRLRKKLGATQKDVADAMGVTPQMISQWENGVRRGRPKTLNIMLNVLNEIAKERGLEEEA